MILYVRIILSSTIIYMYCQSVTVCRTNDHTCVPLQSRNSLHVLVQLYGVTSTFIFGLLLFLSRINDWLKAGIMLAKSVLVLSTLTHAPTAHHEHMIDAAQIMAVQRLARLFPHIHFVTEIRYRFNVKFLRFTPVENTIMRNQRELVS